MAETQASIGKWTAATFPGGDPASPRKALRALEEMVELCLAAGASASDIEEAVDAASLNARATGFHKRQMFYESRPNPAKVPEEAADVQIVLYALAHQREFDLDAEVARKMAVNRARRWRAMGDGTGYHVKDGG